MSENPTKLRSLGYAIKQWWFSSFFCQNYFRFFLYVISLRADYGHNLFNREKKKVIRDGNVGKLHLTNNEVLLTVTHTHAQKTRA